MSFGEFAKKAAQAAGILAQSQLEDAQKRKERMERGIQRYKEHYEHLSDREIYEIYKKTSNVAEKAACSQLLKERGH